MNNDFPVNILRVRLQDSRDSLASQERYASNHQRDLEYCNQAITRLKQDVAALEKAIALLSQGTESE